VLLVHPEIHYVDGGSESRCAARVRASLDRFLPQAHGPQRDPSRTEPVLLFFEEPAPGVLARVRRLSAVGTRRLVAVSLGDSPLSAGDTWDLLAAGASDVLHWAALPDPTAALTARLERWHAVDAVLDTPLVRENLVGRSPVWLSVLREIVEVARFTSANVLITGESGTGKELLARLVHTLDPRPDKRDLVVVDCTTVVPSLSGSEFFGHERGSYTGAVRERDGAFALADGGTLFLDEVGELPPSLQAELLRVVQEGTYKRVGSNTWRKTSFRLVCATNRNLVEDQAQGAFRRDFYYRIAAWSCRVPSLHERTEDILPLARHFLAELRPGDVVPEFDEAVRRLLMVRSYEGNVRDLRNLVGRISSRHVGPGPITVGDVPEDERPAPAARQDGWPDAALETSVRKALALGLGMKDIASAAADTAIRVALDEEGGSLRRASQRLGVTDRALQLRRAQERRAGPSPRARVTVSAGAEPAVPDGSGAGQPTGN
jgi:transcriptional regulator with GAF, ATPase, and Fis domain